MKIYKLLNFSPIFMRRVWKRFYFSWGSHFQQYFLSLSVSHGYMGDSNFFLEKKIRKIEKNHNCFFSKSVCPLSRWLHQPMLSQKKHYWRVYAWKKFQKNILDFETCKDIFSKKIELWFWKFQKCTKSGLLQTKICAEISASNFFKACF